MLGDSGYVGVGEWCFDVAGAYAAVPRAPFTLIIFHSPPLRQVSFCGDCVSELLALRL